MCELSVGDEGQQSEPDDEDTNWYDKWNTLDESRVQNEMTNVHSHN